jgi:hypothetical protein
MNKEVNEREALSEEMRVGLGKGQSCQGTVAVPQFPARKIEN